LIAQRDVKLEKDLLEHRKSMLLQFENHIESKKVNQRENESLANRINYHGSQTEL